MLVLNGDRRGITDAEKAVLERLRGWNGAFLIGGVALSGAFVSERGDDGEVGESDLLVITPKLCVVIEVEAIRRPVDGTLSCPEDEAWSMAGIDGDPIVLRGNDINPVDQAREGVYLAKALAAEVGNHDAFVLGLVLVVPQPKHKLALDRGRWSASAEVRVGMLKDLRRWFQRYGEDRSICWTAEQVHSLLSVLNFAHQITVDELIEQGFPDELTPHSTIPLPAVAVPATDRIPVPDVAPTLTWRGDPFSWLDASSSPPPEPAIAEVALGPDPLPVEPRPRVSEPRLFLPEPQPLPSRLARAATPPQRRFNRALAGVIALCATVIGALLVYVNVQLGATPKDSGAGAPISRPAATPSTPSEAPHPTTLPGCYPFQPDC
ncbi:nuclease-related domain-containing protein [Nocardia yamanashiensis]|uniref:nuclease-related domain-containing protein n=1 Tax=Nocardia yamanashiensis TaxID=209247 RepID=UPI0008352ACC|nr:nuclease-related domain-containing protein [Nocardia yamanashiensis]